MNEKFDLNKALEAIKAGAKIDAKDGVLAPLIKQLTKAALEAELRPTWVNSFITVRTVNPLRE